MRGRHASVTFHPRHVCHVSRRILHKTRRTQRSALNLLSVLCLATDPKGNNYVIKVMDILVDVLLTIFALMTTPSDSRHGTSNSISSKHVLNSEILSVTSAMRKNSRWASSTLVMGSRDPRPLGSNMGLRISSPSYHTRLSGRGSKEAELMSNFVELKRTVKEVEGELTRTLNERRLSPPSRHHGYRFAHSTRSIFFHSSISSLHGANNICCAIRTS